MSIYSVYPSILEGIPETHIQVDGIHGKGNCIEIFLENIIQSPCKVGKYTQMFEGTPVYTSLHAPGKLAQIIRKVVSGNGTVGEVDFLSGRITFTQITFIYISGEFLIHQVGYICTCFGSQS